MDIRSIFETVMASGGYNTSLINDWVNYANSVGIDRALQEFKQNNPGSGGLTTNITPYLTTSQQQQPTQQTNVRSIFEQVMASGGYNTSKIDDWTNYANQVGLDKALQEFKQNNPGSGGLSTNISPYLTTQQQPVQQQPVQQQPAQQQKTVVSNNRVVAANGNRGSFVTYSDGTGEIVFDNGARQGATASGLQASYGFIPEAQYNQQQAAQQQPVQQQPVQQQPVQQQPVQQQPDVRDARSTLESIMISSGYNTNLLDDWVTYANQVGLDRALDDFRQNNPVIQQQPVQQQPGQQQPGQQFNEAEARRLLEGAAKSGGYTTELDFWVDYAGKYGTEKALADYAIANPGVGGLTTDAFSGVASLTANRVLNQPITGGGLASAIPAINLANLYQQAPQFAPVSQTPSTLRQPLQPVDLVAEPQIYPQFGAPIQYIDAQTGLIAPAQGGTEAGSTNMAGGGTVNFQEGGATPLSPAQLGSTFDVSEYIDPETGRFYVNEFQRDVVFNPELSEAERRAKESMTLDDEIRAIRNMNIRKGLTAPTPVGIASANVPVPMGMFGPYQYQKGYEMAEGGLASVAQNLADKGRRGDSMLVHMTPDEVAGLQALAQQMGTSLTINPETGLPEAFSLRKLAKAVLPIAAAVAAPYLAPAFGAFAPLAAGAAAGVGTMVGGGSFKEGLTLGLTSAATAGLTSGIMGANPLGLQGVGTGQSTFNLGNVFGAATPAQQTQVGGPAAVNAGAVDVTGGLTADELLASGRGELLADPAALQPAPAAATGAVQQKAAEKTILGMSPTTALLGGTLAMGALGGAQEQEAYQKQFEEAKAEQRRRRQAGYDAYARSGLANIPIFTGASGGPVALAGGGMTYMEAGGTTGPTGAPRDVTGTGDGMSDSVPATIEGVQEARLADGEFVVPADVVADIGNGSSDAGSKKLYDMMDRIRKARHGTTEQPPEINAEALMPA